MSLSHIALCLLACALSCDHTGRVFASHKYICCEMYSSFILASKNPRIVGFGCREQSATLKPTFAPYSRRDYFRLSDMRSRFACVACFRCSMHLIDADGSAQLSLLSHYARQRETPNLEPFFTASSFCVSRLHIHTQRLGSADLLLIASVTDLVLVARDLAMLPILHV